MIRYERWANSLQGEFLIRFEDGVITGVHCPVGGTNILDGDPERFEFDERPEVLYPFRENPEQYCLLEPWLKGRCIRARSQPAEEKPARSWWGWLTRRR